VLPPHGCPVKHEFPGREAVPAEELWVFGNNYRSLPLTMPDFAGRAGVDKSPLLPNGRGSCMFFCGHFFSSLIFWGSCCTAEAFLPFHTSLPRSVISSGRSASSTGYGLCNNRRRDPGTIVAERVKLDAAADDNAGSRIFSFHGV
jgi:hypothetical protein